MAACRVTGLLAPKSRGYQRRMRVRCPRCGSYGVHRRWPTRLLERVANYLRLLAGVRLLDLHGSVPRLCPAVRADAVTAPGYRVRLLG